MWLKSLLKMEGSGGMNLALVHFNGPVRFMPTIGERLRKIRESLGLSQKGMAEHVEIGASTWPKLENENRLPEDRVLRQLFDEGFDLNWLVTGQGAMKIPSRPLMMVGGVPGFSDEAGRFIPLSDRLDPEQEKAQLEEANSLTKQLLQSFRQAALSDVMNLRVDRELGNRLIAIHQANTDDPHLTGDSIAPLAHLIRSLDRLYSGLGLRISSADIARLAASEIQVIYDVGGEQTNRRIAVKSALTKHTRAAAWAVAELERQGAIVPVESGTA